MATPQILWIGWLATGVMLCISKAFSSSSLPYKMMLSFSYRYEDADKHLAISASDAMSEEKVCA